MSCAAFHRLRPGALLAVLVLGVLSTLMYPAPAHSQFRYERLVDTGEVAPGTDGAAFNRLYTPTMSKSGHVAFVGEASPDDSLEQISGIWRVDSSGITRVASAGQTAPQTDRKFRDFQPPVEHSGIAMGASGEIVFDYSGGPDGTLDGSYYFADGVLSPLFAPGADLPGLSDRPINFARLPQIGVDGTTIFTGQQDGSRNNLDFDVWKGRPGNITRLLDAETIRQATPPEIAGDHPENIAILDASFFTAGIKHTSGPSSLVQVADGRLERIMIDGDVAPGTQGAEFAVTTGVRVNARRQVAFSAWLDDEVGDVENTVNDRGIWLHDSNGLRMVVRRGQHAPGFASGVEFDIFDIAGITADGSVVFHSRLRRTGIPSAAIHTYWMGSSNGIRLIARTGRPAPGTSDPKIRSFNGLHGGLYLNAAGHMVFDVELRTGERALYWYHDGEAEMLLREGGTIHVQDEGRQTVSGFHVPSVYCSTLAGRPCPITDGDQLALLVNTSESGDRDEKSIFRVSPTDTCGSRCETYEYCKYGKCATYPTDVCTPDCTDRMCGPDGCGGYCGTCGRGSTCDDFGECAPDGGCAGCMQAPETSDYALFPLIVVLGCLVVLRRRS